VTQIELFEGSQSLQGGWSDPDGFIRWYSVTPRWMECLKWNYLKVFGHSKATGVTQMELSESVRSLQGGWSDQNERINRRPVTLAPLK
jgi:hypothetical protein